MTFCFKAMLQTGWKPCHFVVSTEQFGNKSCTFYSRLQSIKFAIEKMVDTVRKIKTSDRKIKT